MEEENGKQNLNMSFEECKTFSRDFLRAGAHLNVNKKIIKLFGLEEAVFLSDLISKEKYFEDKEMLDDGWFFNTQENRESDTGLSPHLQNKVIEMLKINGIILTQNRGLPCKKFFKVEHGNLAKLLLNSQPQVIKKLSNKSIKNLITSNLDININNNNINKLKRINSFLNKNLRKNNSTSDEVLVSDNLDSSYKDNNIPLQNNSLSGQGNLGSLPSQEDINSLLKENTPLSEKETLNTLPGEGRLARRTKVQRLRNVSVPVPTKPKLSFTVPKVIQPIIDHWGSCGLKQNRPNTKVCKQTCHAIAQLRQGIFFNNKLTFEKYRNYKFTDEEIKKAIDHFAMAATLDDYSPEAGEYKNRLAKMDLYTFLYNAYNNTGNKSLFIQYLQCPPKLVSSTAALVKDLDPDATAFYRRWWSRLLDEQQLIMNKEITPADENNFRRATASTLKFIEKYRNKFNISANGMWPSLPPGTIAVFVCEAIEADIWDRGGDFSPVTTGWLCTATTWTKRVPNYFLNQDLIRDRSLTNIYEVREKEEEEEDIRQYLDPREIMEEEAST